jgi:hypothetical protein
VEALDRVPAPIPPEIARRQRLVDPGRASGTYTPAAGADLAALHRLPRIAR